MDNDHEMMRSIDPLLRQAQTDLETVLGSWFGSRSRLRVRSRFAKGVCRVKVTGVRYAQIVCFLDESLQHEAFKVKYKRRIIITYHYSKLPSRWDANGEMEITLQRPPHTDELSCE